MCNLYRIRGTETEIARLFGAEPRGGANFAEEVYPGYSGLVVERDAGQTIARTMTWGFPLALTGRDGARRKPKPVTNAREDKLRTAFWRDSFARRRCIVPVSAWAEAEGEKGKMTRTWYGLAGGEPFAVAGLWRPTAEWGDCYAMVMVDGSPQMAEVHDRMPVLLRGEDWRQWLEGSEQDALALCQTCSGELTVDRTAERWVARATAMAGLPQPTLI